MRIALKGSIAQSNAVFLIYTSGITYFFKAAYPGYTNYDVIAIGGGGGKGGGYADTDTHAAGIRIRNYGGAGGGGGFHQVQGLLEILEDSVEVIVGGAGADGIDGALASDYTTDGSDGGFSRFSNFCGASGGKGGIRSESCSISENLYTDGGDGGLGGQTDAGYGGTGGTAGQVTPTNIPGVAGGNGFLIPGPYEFRPGEFTAGGMIGAGGGGGAGGIAFSEDPYTEWSGHLPWATSGGKGAFNSDELVFAPGGAPTLEPDHYMAIVGGIGGGARITPLDKSSTTWGNSARAGVVALLLTKE